MSGPGWTEPTSGEPGDQQPADGWAAAGEVADDGGVWGPPDTLAAPDPTTLPDPGSWPATVTGEAPTPAATPAGMGISPSQVRLVKRPQHRSGRNVAGAVMGRYGGVVLVVVVLVLVVNFLPSARGTQAPTSAAPASDSSVTPATPAYGNGSTVGGVRCGPGVLQVAWSAYAPPCQPAWHGNNGGATTRGVTASTITISSRVPTSSQMSFIFSVTPESITGTPAGWINTLQAYINAFNKSYELYGRHVVLLPFVGKGDFIDELVGQDQSLAQEDAINVATNIKAFADLSLEDGSAVYSEELALQHVVNLSLYENDQQFYEQNAPYVYTPGPNCTKAAQATGAVLGRQLSGLRASFAGSPQLQASPRTYGIIYPSEALVCAQQTAAAITRNGGVVKKIYSLVNVTDVVQDAQTAMAAMKQAGVTTVVLVWADPFTPHFYMTAADTEDYHPEWFLQPLFGGGQTNGDEFTQLFPADQASGLFGMGNQTQAQTNQDALAAYEIGNPDPSLPPVPIYTWYYESVAELFAALQLAGPDLTPQTFQAAMRKIPQSPDWGVVGGWNGATGPYDPASQFRIVHWDATATSPMNGQPGTFVACEGGRWFPYDDPAALPKHTQLTPADCSQAQGVVRLPPSARAAVASAGSSG